jgi:hypothetical protein
MAEAQVRIGGHIGYAMNQDLEVGNAEADFEDAFAYGAQFMHRANEAMSLEVSGTRFSTEVDEIDETEMDIITFAVSLRLGGSPAEGVFLYAGGGGNYNIFDSDYYDDYEDEFGWHFCLGFELPINETAQFFSDFRMTYITLDDEVEADYDFGLLRAGVNFSL